MEYLKTNKGKTNMYKSEYKSVLDYNIYLNF